MVPSQEIKTLLFCRLGVDVPKDNETNIRNFKTRLNSWYDSIKFKDYVKAKVEKDLLEEQVNDIHDIDVRINYKIFELRYFILVSNFNGAHLNQQDLSQYIKIFSPLMTYYYYSFSGLLFYCENNFSLSLNFYTKAREICNKHSIPIEPDLYFQLSLVYNRLSYTAQSIIHAEKALELFNAQFHYDKSLDCQIVLGVNNARIRNFSEAEKQYSAALNRAEKNNDKNTQAKILHNLGMLYTYRNEYSNAIPYFKKSYQIKKHLNNNSSKINTINDLIISFKKCGNIDEARAWINVGVSLSQNKPLDRFIIQLRILSLLINGDSKIEDFIKQTALPFFQKKW